MSSNETKKTSRIDVPGAKPGSHRVIVKKTEDDLAAWLATEEGFASGLMRFNDQPIELEHYQRAFLRSKSMLRGVDKSRQTGYSFIVSVEQMARAILKKKHTGIFVSYNLEDAKEKINYCKQLNEELPAEYQKKLIVETKTELQFASNDAKGTVSRILSNPSKAPRGKHGDIILDELAHYANDRTVYEGSTALTLRSHGQLTICSSPLGRRGLFWEVMKQEIRAYPGYWRQSVPWWLCSFFCVNVKEAAKLAPFMLTHERVEQFGTPGIKKQFGALPIDAFQQEFECAYIDESTAFFPYDLINPCTEDYDPEDDPADLPGNLGRLTAGFDIGRKKDLSEFVIMSDNGAKQRLVMRKSFDRASFEEQEGFARRVLNILPLAWLKIDQNGIGMQLAESLARDYPGVVQPFVFSNQSKEVLAVDLKIAMQKKQITIPRKRELVLQIHSIKRKISASGNPIYDSEDSASSTGGPKQKGHADFFWALAMSVAKNREPEIVAPTIGVRIIGGDDDTDY